MLAVGSAFRKEGWHMEEAYCVQSYEAEPSCSEGCGCGDGAGRQAVRGHTGLCGPDSGFLLSTVGT